MGVGNNSIKGSYSGSDVLSYKPFLYTDPTFIRFAPNETHTITLNYRIISAGSKGFSFGFFSPPASGAGQFLQTASINGDRRHPRYPCDDRSARGVGEC